MLGKKFCGNLPITTMDKINKPNITVKVADGRWSDLLRTKARTMVTANPQSFLCLSQATPADCTLVDLYTALAD